jgi:peptidoglycan/LPS O-acetylase OafA/YrhL
MNSIFQGFGHFGVSGFFILSGFILLWTYNSREWKAKSFYVNRFARIYPLYLFSIIFALPIDLLSPGLSEDNKVSAFILTIGTVQSWFEFSNGRYNSPSWTISVEVFFYVMFPLCFYLKTLSKRIFGLFTVSVIVFTVFNWQHMGHLSPANRLAEFLVGMWLIDVVQSRFVPSRGVAWFSTLLITVGLCGHHLLGLSKYEYVWMPVFAALVILCLAKSDLNGKPVWGSPKWILAGEISYGLYLLHAPIQRYVRQGYKILVGSPLQAASLWVQVAYVLVTSILSVIMAYYVWKWIEVPARSYLRKRFS